MEGGEVVYRVDYYEEPTNLNGIYINAIEQTRENVAGCGERNWATSITFYDKIIHGYNP